LDQNLVIKSLAKWPECHGAFVELINLSENHTFLITSPSGKKTILRVHRAGYHTKSAIYSELNWMVALREQANLKTPRPIAGIDGQLIQILKGGQQGNRFAIMFVFESGVEPKASEDLRASFDQLGVLAAKCHAHAQDWTPPDGFSRLTWDKSGVLDKNAHWGDWRQAPNISTTDYETLEMGEKLLRTRLDEYGESRDRFGIIHADMRLANLLIDAGEVKLIDFDDCGFGWFAYDFAAAISFYEDSKQVPELFTSWLRGYRQERDFSAQDIMMVNSMIMLRRFALLAWVGSHSETELADSMAKDFASVSAQLASRYIKTGQLVS